MTNSAHSTQAEPIIWALPAQYALAQSFQHGLQSSLALGLFVPGILMAYRPLPAPVQPSPAER